MVAVTQCATAIAAFDMPTQRLGTTGDDSSPRLVLDNGQSVRIEIGLAVFAQYVGQVHTVGHDG